MQGGNKCLIAMKKSKNSGTNKLMSKIVQLTQEDIDNLTVFKTLLAFFFF